MLPERLNSPPDPQRKIQETLAVRKKPQQDERFGKRGPGKMVQYSRISSDRNCLNPLGKNPSAAEGLRRDLG